MRRGRWLIFATFTLIISACDTRTNAFDSAAAYCEDVTFETSWLATGRSLFRTYCTSCHSIEADERFGAPEGVDFDTEQDVRNWEERIITRVLEEATMPLGGGIPADDLELFRIYMECGL